MARLIAVFLLAASALAAQGQAQPQKDLKDAGVCARCHVSSSLEWGISKHYKSSVNCTGCHGESAGHVLNEQNGIKPDRIPRRAAIAGLCLTCHQAGCPKTGGKTDCQSCHQVHALVNPTAGATSDERTRELESRTTAYAQQLHAAQEASGNGKWTAARDAYRAALALNPADANARSRLRLAERHLHPGVVGFTAKAGASELRTGLPQVISLAALGVELTLVPGGDFDLGSGTRANAAPVHTVHVETFYIATATVSAAQWTSVMSEPMPAAGVSWNDAQKFVAALNVKLPAGGFRLPTEAEWEYAARTGILDPHAGMSEWCSSLARPYPYRANDGRESLSEDGLRIVRGGNSAEPAAWFDIAGRHPSRPDQRLPYNTFRLAFTPPDPGR